MDLQSSHTFFFSSCTTWPILVYQGIQLLAAHKQRKFAHLRSRHSGVGSTEHALVHSQKLAASACLDGLVHPVLYPLCLRHSSLSLMSSTHSPLNRIAFQLNSSSGFERGKSTESCSELLISTIGNMLF